jgi:hypothetical protein
MGNKLCGKYLGDNDATCPQLTCIRDEDHEGLRDNTRGDDEKRAHDKQLAAWGREVALWRAVLGHPSGMGLDFGGGLISAQRKEDGSFEIEWLIDGSCGHGENGDRPGHTRSRTFVASDIEGAARFLADKRRELGYGLDIEMGGAR